MRFINDGPNVPDRLVQAHEDGKVIFFCGAGISFPAGLPGFDELTQKTFEAVGESPTSAENAAINEKRFDVALGLLEKRIDARSNKNLFVRKKIQAILTPRELSDPQTTATHRALLDLGKDKKGNVRLITTNFDRIFQHVNPSLCSYVAPLLPIPKKSRWDGLVCLHGLLPEQEDSNALNNLILSSGDFGLAYLTERWASRFVSELFRNYIVCFVGYSLGDPVLRYMLDALAADRLRGEESSQVFAFGSYEEEEKEEKIREDWEAKGVEPILYHEKERHSLLQETLKKWAEIYRDGITGRQAVITHEASSLPSPIKNDGHIDRVLWALMEPMGQSAKTFADLDPPPPIEWLEVFTELRFSVVDLANLGVAISSTNSAQISYSLLVRPTSQIQNSPISLVSRSDINLFYFQLDAVMIQLARWIVCHLQEPTVLSWIIKNGCLLHPNFKDLILRELDNPDRVFPQSLQTIWRMMCAGVAKGPHHNSGMALYAWAGRFKRHGWNLTLKRELLHLLRPKVQFRDFPFRRSAKQVNSTNQSGLEERLQIRDYVDWEIVLAIGDHPWEKFREITAQEKWADGALECLPGFTSSLIEVLDLRAELDGACEKSDLSYIHRPSIIDHRQNNEFREWTCLISLCRDAWLSAATQNPTLAKSEFERWRLIKYPLFKRLVLFAATESTLFDDKEALEILLMENAWWLWSPETRRESYQLLLRLSRDLDPIQKDRLFSRVMDGPPREMYREELEDGEWSEYRDEDVWIRLKTISRDGGTLTPDAMIQLTELETKYPQWQLQPGDRHQFSSWSESGWGRIFGQPRTLPTEIDDLIRALETRPINEFSYKDDWRNICQKMPEQAVSALKSLAKREVWNEGVWREALQTFAEGEANTIFLNEIGPFLLEASNPTVRELQHSFSWWLKSLATVIPESSRYLWLQLLDRILNNADIEVDFTQGDPVGRAINNPLGQVIEALISWWYQSLPEAGMGLPEPVKIRLTMLTNSFPQGLIHGRVIMARQLFSLFAVDPNWTSSVLLPLFDWTTDTVEAQGAWQGYLWNPRISAELLATFKRSFLETAKHYDRLGQHDKQYASLLTVSALELRDQFTADDLRIALNSLPPEGLAEAARILNRSLNSANDRRVEYWTYRIKPLLEEIWPKTASKRSGPESAAFMDICTNADTHFPEAADLLIPMIIKTEDFDLPVIHLAESGLARNYPHKALGLLDAIIDESEHWPHEDLRTCLNQIRSGEMALATTPAFRRLSEYLDRHNL
ncbi:MAG: SIR2 family protein [Nitrospirota bacterium]